MLGAAFFYLIGCKNKFDRMNILIFFDGQPPTPKALLHLRRVISEFAIPVL
jgi:hypothetical protein